MSARLVQEMHDHARKCEGRASSYSLAGDRDLARLFRTAGLALRAAVDAVECAEAAEGEELNRSLET